MCVLNGPGVSSELACVHSRPGRLTGEDGRWEVHSAAAESLSCASRRCTVLGGCRGYVGAASSPGGGEGMREGWYCESCLGILAAAERMVDRFGRLGDDNRESYVFVTGHVELPSHGFPSQSRPFCVCWQVGGSSQSRFNPYLASQASGPEPSPCTLT